MNELLKLEKDTRTEATKILEDIVLPILKNYGEVQIGGSYLYELMYQRDIDLILVSTGVNREVYSDLCKEILLLDCVSQFRATDRVNFPHKHGDDRPTGFWLSPQLQFNGHEWGLDIWFQKPEWVDGNNSKYQDSLSDLTEGQRGQVLLLKKKLKDAGKYGVGKEFLSVDVYDAVLENKSVEQLRARFDLD